VRVHAAAARHRAEHRGDGGHGGVAQVCEGGGGAGGAHGGVGEVRGRAGQRGAVRRLVHAAAAALLPQQVPPELGPSVLEPHLEEQRNIHPSAPS